MWKKKTKWEGKKQPDRTSEEVQREFELCCVNLGNIEYQIESMKGKSKALKNRIHELVVENKELEDKKNEGLRAAIDSTNAPAGAAANNPVK